jgi:excinuclease ABC subunit C
MGIRDLREKWTILPEQPGVYQFYDKKGTVIYIGKAKNLKKRVASYFTKQHDHAKVRIMVSHIVDLSYTVVKTETDALLLENNLIKKYRPRYNVLLKDDKTYPWIVIKKEPFPRVFLTRHFVRDGSEYFGPYTSTKLARSLVDMFHRLFPLRTCKHHLTEKNIAQKKFKVCLEYHIKRCKAPCTGQETAEDYNRYIAQVRHILKGNLNEVIVYLKNEMKEYAQTMAFENAQIVKEKLDLLSQFQSKSTVVSPTVHNVDVFGFDSDKHSFYVNYLKINNGAIIQTHSAEIHRKLNETIAEILPGVVLEIREKLNSTSTEIILPFVSEYPLPSNLKIVIPQKGDKKKLLDLSMNNAKFFKFDCQKQRLNRQGKTTPQQRILAQLQQELQMKTLPTHIECFDNSNIQGTTPVASCVVFKNGRPAKKDYRKFTIKTVVGANDFASMEEIVYRRYKRLLETQAPLPQLIVIDGGKGQLNAAYKSLEKLGLAEKITLISIAKRLEEIFIPNHPLPLYLDKRSPSLKLIQQLRDEAHRFGITFHRQKRSKNFFQSELDSVKGIGTQSQQRLYKTFKDINSIKKAPLEELQKLLGKSRAGLLYDYFHRNNETSSTDKD